VAVRKRSSRTASTESAAPGVGLERLINLAALLLVKGEPKPEQIRVLAAAGFGNSEIAALLGLTPNAVNVALHRSRRKE
jgi:DNA-directed RNA polymerase specialized sigma24 family protein